MPFVNPKQRKACYAKDDPKWDCKAWDKEGKMKDKHKKKQKMKKQKKSAYSY